MLSWYIHPSASSLNAVIGCFLFLHPHLPGPNGVFPRKPPDKTNTSLSIFVPAESKVTNTGFYQFVKARPKADLGSLSCLGQIYVVLAAVRFIHAPWLA